ncbi:hypothetical protein, partial [Oceanidesulfovibrio indonesiensis]|uniref:hypothetical protein n=1 Tax=Oceanidesulfovibrio indonesiensis TaxID=54767 RepID=UPI001AC00639
TWLFDIISSQLKEIPATYFQETAYDSPLLSLSSRLLEEKGTAYCGRKYAEIFCYLDIPGREKFILIPSNIAKSRYLSYLSFSWMALSYSFPGFADTKTSFTMFRELLTSPNIIAIETT